MSSESASSVAPAEGFLGWRVCGIAALTQAVAIGFTLGAVGLFAAPIAHEFGATATQFNLAVSVFSLVMNLSMPVVGGFLDRGSIRGVMLIGAVILTTSLVAISQARTLWQVGLAFGVGAAVGMAMLGPMASSTAMANWFSRLRGRALGLANAGGPMGPLIVVPTAAFAIERYGWRMTLLGFAVVTVVVGIPAVWFGMIDRPQDVGQLPDGDTQEVDSSLDSIEGDARAAEGDIWAPSDILRSRDFWVAALAAAPFGAQGIVLGANAIPYLTHQGVSVQAASTVQVLMAVGAIAGPLVFGSLADRIHPRLLFMGLCVTIVLAMAGLAFEPGYWTSLALFAVCGLVGGSMMAVWGSLVGRLFGPESFGQVIGLAALVGLPLIFLGPIAYGAAFDATESYASGLIGMAGLLVVSTLLFSLLPAGEARRAKASLAAASA